MIFFVWMRLCELVSYVFYLTYAIMSSFLFVPVDFLDIISWHVLVISSKQKEAILGSLLRTQKSTEYHWEPFLYFILVQVTAYVWIGDEWIHMKHLPGRTYLHQHDRFYHMLRWSWSLVTSLQKGWHWKILHFQSTKPSHLHLQILGRKHQKHLHLWTPQCWQIWVSKAVDIRNKKH